MNAFVISLLIAGSLCGTAIMIYALRAAQGARDKQQALAEARGWRFTYHPATAGSGSRTVIEDAGEGWALSLCVNAGSSTGAGGGSVTRWTQFDVPALALNDGMAVLGPDLPDKTVDLVAGALRGAGGFGLGQAVMQRMLGHLGEDATRLVAVRDPGPGTLFATPGAEAALSALRDAPDLARARQGRNEAMQPVVIRSREGLRLRMNGVLRKPDEIAGFIDLGRALADKLR